MPKTGDAAGEGPKTDKNTVFVRGVSFDVGDQELQDFFGELGPVRQAFLVKARGATKHKGFGFVQFALQEDAERAAAELNGAELGGRRVQVRAGGRAGGLAGCEAALHGLHEVFISLLPSKALAAPPSPARAGGGGPEACAAGGAQAEAQGGGGSGRSGRSRAGRCRACGCRAACGGGAARQEGAACQAGGGGAGGAAGGRRR